MDPITGIGAAASILELLALCAKSAKAAKELWESYADAPEELRQLARKMEFLKFLLQQIEAFGGHLETENLNHLLPAVHRTIIMVALERRAAQLERLQSLQRDHHTFKSRMRWALLDKSKSEKILKAVTGIEYDLGTCLVIVQARLQTLNQSSIKQVMAAQTAMLPALEAASLRIQSSIQRSSHAHDTTREKIEESLTLVRKDIHVFQDRQLQSLDENATTLKGILKTVAELKPTATTTAECRTPNIEVPSPSPPEQKGLRLGNELFDMQMIKQNSNTNRVMAQHSWTYGWTDNDYHPPPVAEHSSRLGSIAAVAEFESRAYRKKLRAKVRVWFGLFGPRVAEFEFAVHIRSKAWFSPTVEIAVRSTNIRPWSSRIFAYCEMPSLLRAKDLFETGAASINDVSEYGNISLLDYAVKPVSYSTQPYLQRRIFNKGDPTPLVRYLLDIGCDPNLGVLSPLCLALSEGNIDCARLLLRAGADLYSDPERPASSYLCDTSEKKFRAGVEFLRGEDYWAWTDETTANDHETTSLSARRNVLTAASGAGSLEYVMMAIDVLGFPPSRFPYAVNAAIRNSRLEVVSLFHALRGEKKPDVQTRIAPGPELDPPIICAARVGERAIIHYLLLQGAALFPHEEADYLWRSLWLGMDRGLLGDEWIFQEIEGILWHVLLHTEEVGTTNPYLPRRHVYSLPSNEITHGSVARLWSLTDESFLVHSPGLHTWTTDPLPFWPLWPAEEMGECLDNPEKPLAPWITWSAEGLISKYVKVIDESTKATFDPDEEHDGTGLADVTKRRGLLVTQEAVANPFAGSLSTGRQLSAEEMESSDLPNYLQIIADGRDGIPFENTSLFRQTIATEEGRRHMSTFPLVRALCNAFQLAGYRVEMDDSGEIWFEDDDGDPYYDAREYQPGPGEDGSAVANCPICQDPEKHGLGYILRRAEAGERYVDEFRAKRKEKGAASRF